MHDVRKDQYNRDTGLVGREVIAELKDSDSHSHNDDTSTRPEAHLHDEAVRFGIQISLSDNKYSDNTEHTASCKSYL